MPMGFWGIQLMFGPVTLYAWGLMGPCNLIGHGGQIGSFGALLGTTLTNTLGHQNVLGLWVRVLRP